MKKNGVEVQKGDYISTPLTSKMMTHNQKVEEAAKEWELKREYSYGYADSKKRDGKPAKY